MGMRPTMTLVFGIDDFGGQLCDAIMESAIQLNLGDNPPFPDLFLTDVFLIRHQEPRQVYDVLYYQPEFNPGILGLNLASTDYDSDIVRALTVFHPEYLEAGHLDIPILNPDKYPLRVRRLNPLPYCGDIKFQWSWFYSAVVEQHSMWPIHAYCTQWLFRYIGVEVDYQEFKAMLVWRWS